MDNVLLALLDFSCPMESVPEEENLKILYVLDSMGKTANNVHRVHFLILMESVHKLIHNVMSSIS